MSKAPFSLILLISLYVLFAIAALLRVTLTQSFDLFSLGVFPVLFGLIRRLPWAAIALKIYIAIETLGLAALGITAIIAYQVTPDDVKVVFQGHQIPMLPLVSCIMILLAFQYWVAFKPSTRAYLRSPAQ